MSDIALRLRRLQQQSGAVTTSGAMSQQLRAALGLRTRLSCRVPLAAPAGAEISRGVFLVEATIPLTASPTVHLPWDDFAEVSRDRIVCFDTETTGLSGGVGTKAFMIGVAQWREQTLIVRQLYLTALSGEQAMLKTFAAWLAQDSVFVSYNGRSYDAPLLKGRYRMHSQQHPFECRRHVDLLYPTRRLYRDRLPNCRLQTIERNALGIVRDDDLPGAEAPAAWLSFLRGESSTNLGRVVTHNRQDVITLALLLDHVNDQRAAEVRLSNSTAINLSSATANLR